MFIYKAKKRPTVVHGHFDGALLFVIRRQEMPGQGRWRALLS